MVSVPLDGFTWKYIKRHYEFNDLFTLNGFLKLQHYIKFMLTDQEIVLKDNV